ncbi:MAG: hypothetical protein HQK53_09910 [Oligoflexia bacterium]|nr:hypothetical protein [Oligoflexia bacterium]
MKQRNRNNGLKQISKSEREKIKLERTKSLLLLLKIDAKNLLERIVTRRSAYLLEFSLKRSREQFKEIFYSKYSQCKIETLQQCSTDVISSLDQFHTKVDELLWYLNHTQDMIKTADDKVIIFSKVLQRMFDTIELYINAEMTVKNNLMEKLDELHKPH